MAGAAAGADRPSLDLRIERLGGARLGSHRLKDIRPDVIDRFRWDLEQDRVGSSQIRQTLVVLQGLFRYAEERGRVLRNPVKLVRKPSGRRQRAIVVLPPRQVEAVRAALMHKGQFGDATLVSVLAYAGLRPQEALAIEWRHIRAGHSWSSRRTSMAS